MSDDTPLGRMSHPSTYGSLADWCREKDAHQRDFDRRHERGGYKQSAEEIRIEKSRELFRHREWQLRHARNVIAKKHEQDPDNKELEADLANIRQANFHNGPHPWILALIGKHAPCTEYGCGCGMYLRHQWSPRKPNLKGYGGVFSLLGFDSQWSSYHMRLRYAVACNMRGQLEWRSPYTDLTQVIVTDSKTSLLNDQFGSDLWQSSGFTRYVYRLPDCDWRNILFEGGAEMRCDAFESKLAKRWPDAPESKLISMAMIWAWTCITDAERNSLAVQDRGDLPDLEFLKK